MPTSPSISPLVREAQTLAQALLTHDPGRLQHVRGAGLVAGKAAGALSIDEPEMLIAAAWLHDIGYARHIARTGFHPVDGALFLAREGWPEQVVFLVAHHSHAAVLAPYYGVQHHMALLEHVHGHADDILTFSDLRAGPDGLGADPRDRVDDMRRRHAERTFVPDNIHEARYRLLLSAAARINAALNRATRTRLSTSRLAARAS
jgi:hypothetical protein